MPAGQIQRSKLKKEIPLKEFPLLLAGSTIWAGLLGFVFGEFNSMVVIAALNNFPESRSVPPIWSRLPQRRLPRALRVEWERPLAQWRKTGSAYLFVSARLELEKSQRTLRELVVQQRKDLERLMQRLESQQRQAYLDTFEIDKALFVQVSRAQSRESREPRVSHRGRHQAT